MRVIKVDPLKFRDEELHFAVNLLKKGELVAFPTETVYGLGGDALNEGAVKKIFKVKNRPPDNPLIVHVADYEWVYRIAKPNRIAKKLMDEFFPGPLTLVMEKKEIVPDITTAGLKSVAVRMPNHKIALRIIELAETPVSAPSANKSGKPSPTRAEHVVEDLRGLIKCVIDGGKTSIGLESTVVDTTVYPVEILRPGAITREMLEEFCEVKVPRRFEKVKSPGMKYRHYSPEAETIIIVGEVAREEIARLAEKLRREGKRVGVAMMNAEKVEDLAVYDLGRDYEDYARRIFDALRQLDRTCDVIIVEGVEERGIGLAIMNRLYKAGRVYRV